MSSGGWLSQSLFMFRKRWRYKRGSVLDKFLINTKNLRHWWNDGRKIKSLYGPPKICYTEKPLPGKKYEFKETLKHGCYRSCKKSTCQIALFTFPKKMAFFVSFVLDSWMLIKGDHLVHLLTKDTENGIPSKKKRVNIQETTTTNK